MKQKIFLFLTTGFSFLFFTTPVLAHEVYVLKEDEIAAGMQMPLNPFSSLTSSTNILWLVFFASLAVISLLISFRISYSTWGIRMTKLVEKARQFGFLIIRLFLGVSLLFSAYYRSLFGPELPLSHLPYPILWQSLLYVSGILITLGLFTRLVAIVLLVMYTIAFGTFGSYLITYINYLGEILILILVGGEFGSLDSMLFKKVSVFTKEYARSLVVPILRISFGISLLFAAVYAKFLHTQLSYDVVVNYHLTYYFPFDPLFIVLGAGMIEVTIAVIFLLGVNMRWNIFFFAFWATLSLLYFGESVWPHLILFGICIGLFLIGYDQFTLEERVIKLFRKKKKR